MANNNILNKIFQEYFYQKLDFLKKLSNRKRVLINIVRKCSNKDGQSQMNPRTIPFQTWKSPTSNPSFERCKNGDVVTLLLTPPFIYYK